MVSPGRMGLLVLGCMPEYVGGLTMSNSSAFFSFLFLLLFLLFSLFFFFFFPVTLVLMSWFPRTGRTIALRESL